MIKLKDQEYYWLKAPAICEDEPIMIGQYSFRNNAHSCWYIGGELYTAGIGIDVVKHISKPKIVK